MAPLDLLDGYARLTSEFLAAAVDPARWDAAIGSLAATCGDATAHFYAVDPSTGRPLLTATAGHDPQWLAAFEAHYVTVNPFPSASATTPVGQPVTNTDVVPEDVLLRSEYYNDWMRPQGNLYGGAGLVVERSERAVVIAGAMFGAERREALQDDTLRLMGLLGPVILHSWELNQRLAAGALERAVLSRDHGGDPSILVVDETGRPDFVNAAAQAVLAEGVPVRVDLRGRLRFSETGAQSAFEAALRAAARREPAPHDEFAVTLATGAVKRITLSRFDTDAVDGWARGAALGLAGNRILVVIAPEPERRDPAAALHSQFGLTRAEADVALALAEGLTPAEIAESREVSLHTVRNQIKAAMMKCSVRRQLELAALVARTGGE